MSPNNTDYHGKSKSVSRQMKQGQHLMNESTTSLKQAESFLLGRKFLSQNSNDKHCQRNNHTNHVEDQYNKKKAIKFLHQEI